MKRSTKQILACLLKNPRISDRKVADLIGVSQPTVTRHKHALMKAGMLTFSAYPNLAKLGYSIMAFSELSDFQAIPSLRMEDSVIFLAKQPSRLFVISVHKGIEEYEMFEAKYPKIINAMHIVTPLAETEKPLTFSQLIKPDK